MLSPPVYLIASTIFHIFASQSVLIFPLGFQSYGEAYALTLAYSHQNRMKLLRNV